MKHLYILIISLILTSCASHKEFLYFQQKKSKTGLIQKVKLQEITIQPGDILAINISSQIPEATSAYQLNVGQQNFNSPSIINDFLVDDQGYVDFPVLGRLKLGGLSIKKIREMFVEKLSEDLRDPIVNVRLINFSIVVIGEVRRPSTYTIGRQQVTIFEAIGLAGDLTDQADREEVIVVREVDGIRTSKTLNLLKASILDSDYYYLRQNDVIYVPPTKRKSFVVSTQSYSQVIIPIIGVLLSVTTLFLTISRTR